MVDSAVFEKLSVGNIADISVDDIATLLRGDSAALTEKLYALAKEIRNENVGNKTYFRGLIEMSNICAKNCHYCGIRGDNAHVDRYMMSAEEVLDACQFAYERQYGSVVIQTGEMTSAKFVEEMTGILSEIRTRFKDELRVTLSLGEQEEEVYRRWFAAGASRYLLRIETSDPELYQKLHPSDGQHSFAHRVECLYRLRRAGYQVGSGIMIGLPGQSYAAIARDLLFLKKMDVDMVGMGPYIEHEDTPMFSERDTLWPLSHRFDVSVRAVAVLRILMKSINIAAATALQAIHPTGRERALEVGANVIMPNLTPTVHRKDYSLYANKPCTDEDRGMCSACLEGRVRSLGQEIGKGEWGDSVHFVQRKK